MPEPEKKPNGLKSLDPKDLLEKAFSKAPIMTMVLAIMWVFQILQHQRDEHLMKMLSEVMALVGGH